MPKKKVIHIVGYLIVFWGLTALLFVGLFHLCNWLNELLCIAIGG